MSPTFHILLIPSNTRMSQSSPSFHPETLSTVTFLSMHTPGLGPNILKEEAAISLEADGKYEAEKERTPPDLTPPVPGEGTAGSTAPCRLGCHFRGCKALPKAFYWKEKPGRASSSARSCRSCPFLKSLCGRNSIISVMFVVLEAGLL